MRDALRKGEEIQLIVKGRITGKETSRPVWFVLRDNHILLLPVTGSRSQWFKNTVKNPQVKITIEGEAYTGETQPLMDKRDIQEVVDLFKKKYGEGDIKRYYPRLDAASRLSLK